MTAIEQLMVTSAQNAIATDEEAGRDKETSLEQRLAICISEQRGLEARHIAGEILMRAPKNPLALQIYRWLIGRSDALMKMSIGMIDVYPPDTQPDSQKPMVTLE